MRIPLPGRYPATEGPLEEAVQVNEVPATEEERLMAEDPPEQKVCVAGEKMTLATGNTVTTKGVGSPGQPLAEGVTW